MVEDDNDDVIATETKQCKTIRRSIRETGIAEAGNQHPNDGTRRESTKQCPNRFGKSSIRLARCFVPKAIRLQPQQVGIWWPSRAKVRLGAEKHILGMSVWRNFRSPISCIVRNSAELTRHNAKHLQNSRNTFAMTLRQDCSLLTPRTRSDGF